MPTCSMGEGGKHTNGKVSTSLNFRHLRSEIQREECPEFLKRLQSVEVETGYTVHLSVEVASIPPPNITWYKDNILLNIDEDDESTEFWDGNDQHTMILYNIGKRQEGAYRCLAENSHGSSSTCGYITVKDHKKQKKRRFVSQRPLISTIKEWQSMEDKEASLLAEVEDTDDMGLYSGDVEDIEGSLPQVVGPGIPPADVAIAFVGCVHSSPSQQMTKPLFTGDSHIDSCKKISNVQTASLDIKISPDGTFCLPSSSTAAAPPPQNELTVQIDQGRNCVSVLTIGPLHPCLLLED